MTTTPDLSKVPYLKERQEVEQLYAAFHTARDAMEAARTKPGNEVIEEKYDKLLDEAAVAHDAKCDEIDRQRLAELGITSLVETVDQAEKAIASWDERIGWENRARVDIDDNLIKCALSNLPLLHSDDVDYPGDDGDDDADREVEILACLGPAKAQEQAA